MKAALVWLKQVFDAVFPSWRRRWLAYGVALSCAALAFWVGCGCTSTRTGEPVVLKQALGWTYSVEPVESPLLWQGPPWTPQPRTWTEQAGGLLSKVTWFMVVGGLLLVYVLYKFPALLRRLRERRAGRERLGG